MARQKHKPQRTCIACRETQEKRALIRVVRTPEGQVKVDLTGKANGRGAYLCQQAGCWQKSLQKQLLARALKTTISAEDLAGLQSYFETELSKV
ncbi:MAG: YlxR family protein [Dehalococcoidia bacterium]|nr:MAG: YlxR family protein [Dehalococcoidia bacterium]